MEFIPTSIPGCWELHPKVHEDERGRFVKVFHAPTFRERGLETSFGEEYYSVSKKRVLRGLHFHAPPQDHAKLVYCAAGAVLDAVLDLRQGSPTFGRHALFELDARRPRALYIPRGLAHGFYARADDALMVYQTTTPYSPQHDAGVRWDSAGIPWPDRSPLVSPRDLEFPTLAEFKTSFSYAPA